MSGAATGWQRALGPGADPPVVVVRPTTCSQARLQKAMDHAATAAARYYQTSDDEAPEQYRQDLEGVEVKPTDVVELVLSTYEQLRSVRKTTDKFGLNREKVRRIIAAA